MPFLLLQQGSEHYFSNSFPTLQGSEALLEDQEAYREYMEQKCPDLSNRVRLGHSQRGLGLLAFLGSLAQGSALPYAALASGCCPSQGFCLLYLAPVPQVCAATDNTPHPQKCSSHALHCMHKFFEPIVGRSGV